MVKESVKFITAALAAACVVPVFAGCAPGAGESETQPANITSEAESENITTGSEGTQTESFGETKYSHTSEATVYDASSSAESAGQEQSGAPDVVESGSYTSMEEVSAYIHEFGHLPDNYITKKEAKKLGWKTEEGNLTVVAPGKSIGGDSFGNREGELPKKKGRKYYECDIDYTGGTRNAKRLVYSNDGLIYYTEDHYNTFELLYGEE